MYIVIETTTQKSAIIKDKTELSGYIGVSISTISRKSNLIKWEYKQYTIYKPEYCQLKSNRGGKRDKKQGNDYF